MKTLCIVLFVALLAVLGGRVHARVASVVSANSLSGNDVTECRLEAIPNTTIPFILLNKQHMCYKPSAGFLGRLNAATNTDAFRSIFRSACSQETSVRACIADVGVEASSCLTEMEMKMFDTVRDFVESSIEETCANGSEAVATMYGDELKPLSLSGQLRVLSCMTSVMAQTLYDNETDQAAYTLRRYRAMKDGRRCIGDVARKANRSANVFEQFMDTLINKSKCIDAVTHEIVLCHTLDQLLL